MKAEILLNTWIEPIRSCVLNYMCSTRTTKHFGFPWSDSEPLAEWVWKHTALHFSLKRNVYLNQTNNRRETSDLCCFAYKSCSLHSCPFPQGDTFVSSFVSYNKDKGEKRHSCFEKQQVITSQSIKPNEILLPPAFPRKWKSSRSIYYWSPWPHLENAAVISPSSH